MARIAILTADIAIASDGVADYSRLLAAELARQGHVVLLIGLMQSSGQWVRYFNTDHQPELNPEPHWPERLERVGQLITDFNPGLVSFQYVCFSFGRYGLPLHIGRDVRRIAGNRPIELMAHELWTCISRPADMKTYLLGTLQQLNFRELLRQIRPQCVHVSNPAYVRLLERIGCRASVLPLFGNIPVTDVKDSWLSSFTDHLRLMIFGSIHPEWSPSPLMEKLVEFADSINRKLMIISAGSQGRGKEIWRNMVDQYQARIAFHALGRMDAGRVSALMNAADYGIATSPMSLIGKSGTAAAMLEHDMPVIVTRDEPCYSVGRVEPAEGYGRFIRLDDSFEMQMEKYLGQSREMQSRLPLVAKEIIDLNDITRNGI